MNRGDYNSGLINTANRTQTIGNIIVVDPRNGDLYDFTDLLLEPNTPRQGTRSNAQLAFVKSIDGGDTWTQPQIIAPFNSLGVRDPNTGEALRVGDGLEEVAVDAHGKLYVVWESSTNYLKQLKQSTNDTCLSCHTHVKQQLASAKHVHGAVLDGNGQGCAACHDPHASAQPAERYRTSASVRTALVSICATRAPPANAHASSSSSKRRPSPSPRARGAIHMRLISAGASA